MFPSTASLERLAGAVMCDMDEAWADARYFSEEKMSEQKKMDELWALMERRGEDGYEPSERDLSLASDADASIIAATEVAMEREAA